MAIGEVSDLPLQNKKDHVSPWKMLNITCIWWKGYENIFCHLIFCSSKNCPSIFKSWSPKHSKRQKNNEKPANIYCHTPTRKWTDKNGIKKDCLKNSIIFGFYVICNEFSWIKPFQALTRTKWYAIPLIWLPVVCWCFFRSLQMGHTIEELSYMAPIGMFIWTLIEYTLHRFLFHIETQSYW